MSTFTYESKYGTYKESFFRVGHYENGNLAIEICSIEEGNITRVKVNPDIKIPQTQIAVKDYFENEGMVDWLISQDIIEQNPVKVVESGWVEIPIFNLTPTGIKMLEV